MDNSPESQERYAAVHLWRDPDGWVVWDYDRQTIAEGPCSSELWCRQIAHGLNSIDTSAAEAE